MHPLLNHLVPSLGSSLLLYGIPRVAAAAAWAKFLEFRFLASERESRERRLVMLGACLIKKHLLMQVWI